MIPGSLNIFSAMCMYTVRNYFYYCPLLLWFSVFKKYRYWIYSARNDNRTYMYLYWRSWLSNQWNSTLPFLPPRKVGIYSTRRTDDIPRWLRSHNWNGADWFDLHHSLVRWIDDVNVLLQRCKMHVRNEFVAVENFQTSIAHCFVLYHSIFL